MKKFISMPGAWAAGVFLGNGWREISMKYGEGAVPEWGLYVAAWGWNVAARGLNVAAWGLNVAA